MSYWVTRQKGYYDEGVLRIEIATDRDEVSPGMLTPNYEEEGEYETAYEAAEAAVKLSEHYPMETMPEITISAAASFGMYPTSDDGKTVEELEEWARKRDEADTQLHESIAAEWDEGD